MDPSSVVIKIKGLNAIPSLSAKGPLVGVVKLKGAAAGTAAVTGLHELEAGRAVVTKKGVLLYGAELEPDCIAGLAKASGGKAALGKAALGKAGVSKAVIVKSAATGGKAAIGTGAALSAKSVGWGLGLGGLGPWLALGALGLAATGIYLYLRSQQPEAEIQEPDDFESPV